MDPAARRRVGLVLVVAAGLGSLSIAGFIRYRASLTDWVLADPRASAHRIRLVFVLLTTVLAAPLLAFSAYLWWLGEKVVRAREYPPPGLRVIRDTPIITGDRAACRGRVLKVLAVGFGVASVVLIVLVWRLGLLLGRHAA